MLKTAPEFEVVDVPQETFAFVVRRVAPDEVGEFIHGALSRVAEFAADHGGPLGPPMAITTAQVIAGRKSRRVNRPARTRIAVMAAVASAAETTGNLGLCIWGTILFLCELRPVGRPER